MKSSLNYLFLIAVIGLVLSGCGAGNPAPSLAAAGQPTLVFLYTQA